MPKAAKIKSPKPGPRAAKALERMPKADPAAVRVKICGITSREDAQAAVDAGADALGFNFYPASPRAVTLTQAAGIIAQLPPFVAPVAVWVEPSLAQVREALGACRWSALQFSGEESDDLLLSFPADLVLRTVRLGDKRDLTKARHLIRSAGLLVDASVPGQYGGTGRLARWDLARELAKAKTVILAGGLTEANVAEAVRQVRPYGVDTASGVERSPGKKDAAKMRAFIKSAKMALN